MLQLLLGTLLFALSLLTVLPPPAYWLWLLSVPVKEGGYLLALLCLPLLWPGWIGSWPEALGAVLALGAALLFLIPLLRALPVARRLPGELEAAFGPGGVDPSGRLAPLLLLDLFRGARLPRLPVETRTYAAHGDRELQMDITRPHRPGSAPAGAPVVIVIHGGSWRSGDRKQLPALNRYLAARGYLVAAIDYRLAPDHPFPAPLEDVRAAIAYIKQHAGELGADPERIALLGRSAGAQLAVLAAYTAGDPAIRGAISFYGPFDLAWGWSLPGWILDSRTILGGYLGGSPEEAPQAYRDASPLTFVGEQTPPTLMIQGEADVLVSPLHNVKLSEKLRAAGRPHQIVMIPHATHGSDFHFSGPFGQISTFAVERFLRSIMR